MSKLRCDILYNRRIKEAHELDKEFRKLHITKPITQEELLDSENTQELNNTENELINYELNDYIKNNDLKDNNELITEDNNNLITEEEEQWNILIDEWSAISEQENINEEQESSKLNEITHPADNRNAK